MPSNNNQYVGSNILDDVNTDGLPPEAQAALLRSKQTLAAHYAGRSTRIPNANKKSKNNGLKAFGLGLAFFYGLLCGIGIVASVNDALMSNPMINFSAQGVRALAFALGGINWFVNVGFFCFVVPAMLVRLFSWDLFQESYRTENGKYVKIKAGDKVHETQNPYRKALIWSFIFVFGLAASLVYTGLLISKLPETLSLVGIPLGGVGLTVLSGVFFGISMICNWMFNTYDAAENFTQSDFFDKFKAGARKLFLIEPAEELLLKTEQYNKDVWLGEGNQVGRLGMTLRQVQRLAIIGGIAYLAYAALLSVTQMGAPAFLAFLHIPAVPFLIPIITLTSIAGFAFLYGVQTLRFSELAVQLSASFGNFYGGAAENAIKALGLPMPSNKMAKVVLTGFLHLTLVAPILYTLGSALFKIVETQGHFLTRALARPLPTEALNDNAKNKIMEEYNEGVDFEDEKFVKFQDYWNRDGFAAWLQRATYSGQTCYEECSKGLSVLAVIPALVVTVFNFLRENFYTLTIANAAANGFLAIKPPVENADGILVPAESTGQTIKSGIGGGLMSGMCAANNYEQTRLKEEGASTDEQQTVLEHSVVFSEDGRNFSTHDGKKVMFSNEAQNFSTEDGQRKLKRVDSVVVMALPPTSPITNSNILNKA